MAKIYWCPVIENRLVLDDEAVTLNGADLASLLVFDVHHTGIVSIFQDSNVQMIRDKFEAIDERVEIGNIDETIDMFLDVLVELERKNNDKQFRKSISNATR